MNKTEEIFTSDYYDTLNIDKGEKEAGFFQAKARKKD